MVRIDGLCQAILRGKAVLKLPYLQKRWMLLLPKIAQFEAT